MGVRRALPFLAVLAAASPAAAQSWDIYAYPDAKFVAQFPAQPTVTSGSYRTEAGLERPARIWSAVAGNVAYSLTLADFNGTALDKDAVITDAVKAFGRLGEVAVDVEARINTEYGRELSVVRKDGGRSITAIFFFDKHLYLLHGQAMPPNPGDSTANLIRFQQSLQFTN
jgi:hypothetical protein